MRNIYITIIRKLYINAVRFDCYSASSFNRILDIRYDLELKHFFRPVSIQSKEKKKSYEHLHTFMFILDYRVFVVENTFLKDRTFRIDSSFFKIHSVQVWKLEKKLIPSSIFSEVQYFLYKFSPTKN